MGREKEKEFSLLLRRRRLRVVALFFERCVYAVKTSRNYVCMERESLQELSCGEVLWEEGFSCLIYVRIYVHVSVHH